MNRFGARAFATLGLVIFALACLWWAPARRRGADYAGEMLPGLLAAGLGVGVVLPSLASAAAASVPRERFATGSAIYTMTRQLGFVLGVSIFVACSAHRVASIPSPRFDRGWTFMVIASALRCGHSAPHGAGAAGRAGPPRISRAARPPTRGWPSRFASS